LLCLAVGVFGVGAWPVAARTMRSPQPPPPLAVRVQYGESVWTIARKHADPDRDVRAVVAEMLRLNPVDPQALQPGQTLLIPADCLPKGHR
jgi:Tfp pilus assembly protein FimV